MCNVNQFLSPLPYCLTHQISDAVFRGNHIHGFAIGKLKRQIIDRQQNVRQAFKIAARQTKNSPAFFESDAPINNSCTFPGPAVMFPLPVCSATLPVRSIFLAGRIAIIRSLPPITSGSVITSIGWNSTSGLQSSQRISSSLPNR